MSALWAVKSARQKDNTLPGTLRFVTQEMRFTMESARDGMVEANTLLSSLVKDINMAVDLINEGDPLAVELLEESAKRFAPDGQEKLRKSTTLFERSSQLTGRSEKFDSVSLVGTKEAIQEKDREKREELERMMRESARERQDLERQREAERIREAERLRELEEQKRREEEQRIKEQRLLEEKRIIEEKRLEEKRLAEERKRAEARREEELRVQLEKQELDRIERERKAFEQLRLEFERKEVERREIEKRILERTRSNVQDSLPSYQKSTKSSPRDPSSTRADMLPSPGLTKPNTKIEPFHQSTPHQSHERVSRDAKRFAIPSPEAARQNTSPNVDLSFIPVFGQFDKHSSDDSFEAISTAIRKSLAGKHSLAPQPRLSLPEPQRKLFLRQRSSIFVPLPEKEPIFVPHETREREREAVTLKSRPVINHQSPVKEEIRLRQKSPQKEAYKMSRHPPQKEPSRRQSPLKEARVAKPVSVGTTRSRPPKSSPYPRHIPLTSLSHVPLKRPSEAPLKSGTRESPAKRARHSEPNKGDRNRSMYRATIAGSPIALNPLTNRLSQRLNVSPNKSPVKSNLTKLTIDFEQLFGETDAKPARDLLPHDRFSRSIASSSSLKTALPFSKRNSIKAGSPMKPVSAGRPRSPLKRRSPNRDKFEQAKINFDTDLQNPSVRFSPPKASLQANPRASRETELALEGMKRQRERHERDAERLRQQEKAERERIDRRTEVARIEKEKKLRQKIVRETMHKAKVEKERSERETKQRELAERQRREKERRQRMEKKAAQEREERRAREKARTERERERRVYRGNNIPLPDAARGKVRSQQPRVSAPAALSPIVRLPEIPSDDDVLRRTKHLKEWANTPQLKRAIHHTQQLDPISVFGEIPAFNMEEVFQTYESPK